MPKLSLQKLKTMSINALKAVNASAVEKKILQSYVKQARTLLGKRLKTFELKSGGYKWSPAVSKIVDYVDQGQKPVSRMSPAALKIELARIQSFFTAESATVKGAQKVARDQDARIFGTDEAGRPLRRMNRIERDRFWEAYEKYAETYASSFYRLQSSKVQEFLGRTTVWRGRGEIGADDMSNLNRFFNMLERSERNPELRRPSDGAVYRGEWNDNADRSPRKPRKR